MLTTLFEETEAAGYSLLASCFSDTGGRGGLFLIGSAGVEQLDRIHTTGLAVGDGEVIRLLRCPDAALDCTVRVYRAGQPASNYEVAGLQDGHDVVPFDGTYVAVSASTNSILFFDGAGRVTRRIVLPGDRDAWHVNSLVVRQGKLLASAFGRFQEHRQWDSDARSHAGIVFDVETGEDVITGLTCPHQPKVCDDGWVVCNSGERSLVELDATARVIRSVQLGGWTRGLAVADRFFYIGVTPPRYDGGELVSARVAIVSRAKMVELETIELPADEIYDLVFVRSELVSMLRKSVEK